MELVSGAIRFTESSKVVRIPMSIWQAVGFWVLASLFVTIVVPLIAFLGWQLYVYLTPAGRAWKAASESY